MFRSRQRVGRFAITLALSLGTLAWAQPLSELEGTVVESFGLRFILQTPSERILVAIDDPSLPIPSVGERLRVSGVRRGSTLEAETLTRVTGNSPEVAPDMRESDAWLPSFLQGLDLHDVWRYEDEDGELSLSAVLPDGSWMAVEIEQDGENASLEIEASQGIPFELLQRVAPEALLMQEVIRGARAILKYEQEGDVIDLELFDAAGFVVDVEADRAGRILDVEREEREASREARVDRTAIENALLAWGYRDVREIEQSDSRIEVRATNPFGEPVLLHLDRALRVTRERILWGRDD